jgi:diguanylate cyclase (GGDEF)-like protein
MIIWFESIYFALLIYFATILVIFIELKNTKMLKKAKAELELKAFTDELTGLGNRRALNQLKTTPNSIKGAFYIDLDRFKLINNTLGHETGDIVLKTVSERIQSVLNKNDIAFRLGGDEFFILVTHPETLEDLILKASEILKEIQKPYLVSERELRIDASIGVVDKSAGSITDLMKASDIAMYAAKEQGSICVGWTKELIDKQRKKSEIQLELQSLRDKYSREFELLYQPIVNLKDPSKIESVEALLRWRSGRLGNVNPIDFIPIAEDTGDISCITSWVLQTAIKQISKWEYTTPISINVSPRDLEQSNFIENLKQYCDQNYVNFNLISLEITERAVAGNLNYYNQVLQDLNKLNIALKIDDFGIGDSSLKRLLESPWKFIKIDCTLIPKTLEDKSKLKVCRAIQNLSKDLGITVIAEGVETETQRMILIDLGIEQGQGFLFAKPLKPSELSFL